MLDHASPLPGLTGPAGGDNFASDNAANLCPTALAALIEANGQGHSPSYGGDTWTAQLIDRIRQLFQAPNAQVFFVFNGTAANALALAHLCQPWEAVITHPLAHIQVDESGAPEFFGAARLMLADGPDGRLDPDAVIATATRRRDVHHVRPAVISVTQATEVGTRYQPDDLRALARIARAEGMRLHMDGARFANAVAASGLSPAALTWQAGVDVMSFGGTKNGLGIGEAVVFFDPDLARDFDRRVKQAGQLASKQRLISAPWLACLQDDTWLVHAAHANAMAGRLAGQLARIGIVPAFPVEANGVFARLPNVAADRLAAAGWRFHRPEETGTCRFMCAWDTRPETVDRLAADIAAALAAG